MRQDCRSRTFSAGSHQCSESVGGRKTLWGRVATANSFSGAGARLKSRMRTFNVGEGTDRAFKKCSARTVKARKGCGTCERRMEKLRTSFSS